MSDDGSSVMTDCSASTSLARRTCPSRTVQSSADHPHGNDLSTACILSTGIPITGLQPDSATDAADVSPLNINVQSHKKLLEKNLFDDLSSQQGAKRVDCLVDDNRVQQIHSGFDDKACQTTESSVRRTKLVRSLRRRTTRALCLAGWIVCCPCWTVGFVLREPLDYYSYDNYDSRYHPQQQQQQQQRELSDYDESSAGDPCWPCDNLRRPVKLAGSPHASI